MKLPEDLLPAWAAEKRYLPSEDWEKRRRRLSLLVRAVQRVLYFLPVKKNRVMVYTHEREGFSCNPKYIVRKLRELYGEKLEIIWVTSYPETCPAGENPGVQIAATNSALHIRKYMRTRVYVTNDGFPPWAVRRPNQRWVNTWHGGMNYKRIGYRHLEPMSRDGFRLYCLENRRPDIYLAGSKYFIEDTARSFFLPEEIFVNTGLPRNDIFFTETKEPGRKIREKYGLSPEVRIILYAPTFRRGMESVSHGLDFAGLGEALAARFGGEWVVLFRNHNFIRDGGKKFHGETVDVSGYDDMQELLYVSDVLVSDYSSCMWDFCLTGRPCFVYASDMEDYMANDRTLGFPPERLPFPVAATNGELAEAVAAFDESEYHRKVREHLAEQGSFDRGDASEQAAVRIGSYCNGPVCDS